MTPKALSKILLLSLLSFSAASFAIHKAFAVYSPSCPEKVIVKLAGDALININKVQFSEGLHSFNVTLETRLMTYQDLIKKMQQRGCYLE